MHSIVWCFIVFLVPLDYVVTDGILRLNFHSLMQESHELDSYCHQNEYLCRIEATYCVRFGNSSEFFECNYPNIQLKVSAYAYKENNEYALQFNGTQRGSNFYFVLQTDNSFDGTFEIYSKIKTYSPTFVRENYYSAYFLGSIQRSDNIKPGVIHGIEVVQQVNTTLNYQLICAIGYTGLYCNIECTNETCPLTNGLNDFSPVIINPSNMSTIIVNISSSSYKLVNCVAIGESVESYWLDSNLQPVSNDNLLFIGLHTLSKITVPTPYYCNAFNNNGFVIVTIYIHVVGGNRSRIDILSDVRQGILNEPDLDESDLAYFNDYLLFATDELYDQLEHDYTTELIMSGQDKYEFDDNYYVSDEYYTELYELSSTYNNLVQRFTNSYNLLQQQSVTKSLLNTANDILRVSNKPGITVNKTTASIQNTNALSNQSPFIVGATSKAYDALEFISLNFANNIEDLYGSESFLLSYESISVYASSWTKSEIGVSQYLGIPEYYPQIGDQIQIPVELINQFSVNRDKFSIAASFVDLFAYDGFEANADYSQIASRIIQVVLPTNYVNASETLFPNPIQINFNATPLNSTEHQFTCVFLNKTTLEWSTNNVYIGNITNTSIVTCNTKHLTSFAVLVTPTKITTNTVDYTISRILSYFLGSLSFICLILSLILFIASGKKFFKIEANLVYFNSCLAMLFAMTIYVFASQSFTFNIYLCKAVAFLLHYTWLALFFWMLCIGLLILYSISIGTLRKRRIFPFLFIIGWLVPIIIPIITLGVGFNKYIDDDPQYCFLHHSLIYAFIGPVFVIVFLNFIIFCITLCKIFYALKKTNNYKSNDITKKTIITGFTLTPILGLPWGITIFGIFIQHPVISWLHVILNGSLGIVFFFVVVLQNDEVQALLCKSRAKKRRLSKKNTMLSNSGSLIKHRPRARSNKQTEECLNETEISPSNSISKSPNLTEVYVSNTETNDKGKEANCIPANEVTVKVIINTEYIS